MRRRCSFGLTFLGRLLPLYLSKCKLFKQVEEHIHSGLSFSNGALTDSQVLLLMDLEYDLWSSCFLILQTCHENPHSLSFDISKPWKSLSPWWKRRFTQTMFLRQKNI